MINETTPKRKSPDTDFEDDSNRASQRKIRRGQSPFRRKIDDVSGRRIEVTPNGGTKTVFLDEQPDYNPDSELDEQIMKDNDNDELNEEGDDEMNPNNGDSEEDTLQGASQRYKDRERSSPSIVVTDSSIPTLNSLLPDKVQDFVNKCNTFLLQGLNKPMYQMITPSLWTQLSAYPRKFSNWKEMENKEFLQWLSSTFPNQEDLYASAEE